MAYLPLVLRGRPWVVRYVNHGGQERVPPGVGVWGFLRPLGAPTCRLAAGVRDAIRRILRLLGIQAVEYVANNFHRLKDELRIVIAEPCYSKPIEEGEQPFDAAPDKA